MSRAEQTAVRLSERDLPLLHARQPQAASGGGSSGALEQRQSGHVSLRQHNELPDYYTAPENHLHKIKRASAVPPISPRFRTCDK